MGLCAQSATPQDNISGIYACVQQVAAGGLAARNGLLVGDMIVQVGFCLLANVKYKGQVMELLGDRNVTLVVHSDGPEGANNPNRTTATAAAAAAEVDGTSTRDDDGECTSPAPASPQSSTRPAPRPHQPVVRYAASGVSRSSPGQMPSSATAAVVGGEAGGVAANVRGSHADDLSAEGSPTR
jgi:hypothetical protein